MELFPQSVAVDTEDGGQAELGTVAFEPRSEQGAFQDPEILPVGVFPLQLTEEEAIECLFELRSVQVGQEKPPVDGGAQGAKVLRQVWVLDFGEFLSAQRKLLPAFAEKMTDQSREILGAFT